MEDEKTEDEGSEESEGSGMDSDDPLTVTDTKYTKSFRHFTREALPRLDNYRNVLSLHAAPRPTLDELHNASLSRKPGQTLEKDMDSPAPPTPNIKFGWIKGVLMRCLLNIWGVMLFLRLSWVVGQAGIIQAMLLILTTSVVTTITALSMSAISTNGVIKGGGTYYMISRSLGPEFGGSIGLIFAMANAVACAMYVVGFGESLITLIPESAYMVSKSWPGPLILVNLTGGTYYMISRSLGPEFGGSIGLIFAMANAVACAMYVVGFGESLITLIPESAYMVSKSWDQAIYGCITIVLLTGIVMVGMEWEAKAQIVLLIILLAAIADFCVGSFIGPKSDIEFAQGFVGYNMSVLQSNLASDYRYFEGAEHNFFSVFSIFFPAATGILAGANISGDLKDPQKSIPKGTLLAILLTTLSYLVIALIAGWSVLRDASGDVNALTDCLHNRTCTYGLHNSNDVIRLVSAWGPLIYGGCFAATLSSALASLVSAPKVFQALCQDKLYPYLEFFAKGYGTNNEPVRGYVLTFIIAVAFILMGGLNQIAPLISNFFLAAYALINFSTFHASLAKPVGWRPTFRLYNKWLSLCGAALCVVIMFVVSWATALLTFAFLLTLYLLLYNKWLSLCGAALCVVIMFVVSWATALLTFAFLLTLYLLVSHRKPDVNWGSTTQAQTYKTALSGVQQLNRVTEHVKNYRPQILVLTGFPGERPVLCDFAYLLTKGLSLMLCGHISQGQISHRTREALTNRAYHWFLKRKYDNQEGQISHRTREALTNRAYHWFLKRKVKAFYSVVDDVSFKDGASALIQASGVGKLKPNILMMGFKEDWQSCDRAEIVDYVEVMHKALDVHMALAILRVEGGLYSGDALDQDLRLCLRDLSLNDTAAFSRSMGDSYKDSKSTESLNTHSQGSSMSDVSLGVSRDPSAARDTQQQQNEVKSGKSWKRALRGRRASSFTSVEQFTRRQGGTVDVWWLYDDGGLTLLLPYILSTRRAWSSCPLRVFTLANKTTEMEIEERNKSGKSWKRALRGRRASSFTSVEQFTRRQAGTVDVWWLYDDGGLTLLLPYILSTRRAWSSCPLRVFTLANKTTEMEIEERNMASLLSKFRIDYSALKMVSDVNKKPRDTTLAYFDKLVAPFMTTDDNVDNSQYFTLSSSFFLLYFIFHTALLVCTMFS
ncbi:Bumetanide-sensitive sodium-(potassium)-chloride cotransporter [Papilio machaon]|uniref:Bumetanide-sensitive sodium-(Potassium)-chloride cotransporter n=1 Tax=Papilio machaon TaxID=76193 RepID=A0A194RA22_PAPMA|nr:Bumetanide-sensitive sodium-(potassium)-chloride cotransporter [Papilio machaon]